MSATDPAVTAEQPPLAARDEVDVPQRWRRAMLEQLISGQDGLLWSVAAYAAVALGCVLRILRWADNPSLWLDEALLALNLLDMPLGEILGTLQFLQAAPPAFLLATESVETVLGDSEWSLRLVPLLASLASVVLLAYVARRLLTPPAAALAIILFATGEPLLLRSADAKHYSVDVAVTTGLLALSVWAVSAKPDRAWRRFVVVAALAPLALWLSFAAAFTIAGIVVALGLRGWQSRSRAAAISASVIAIASVVVLVAALAVAGGNAGRVSASVVGRDDPALSVGRLKTIEDAWWTLVEPGGFDNGRNALAALLGGFALAALTRRETLDRLALLVVPLALAAVADMLDRYPLGGRFSQFLVPPLVIFVATGAQALVGWSRRPVLVAAGVGMILASSPVAVAAYHAFEPPARSDVKPLLRHLVQAWEDGDSLYVYGDSQYQLRYYAQCETCSISGADMPWPTKLAPPSDPSVQYAPALLSVPPHFIVGSTGSSERSEKDFERLPTSGRVWLLFSTDSRTHDGLDDEKLLLHILEEDGSRLADSVVTRGARLYLIDR